MKELEFLGDALKALSEFPRDARQAAGYQPAEKSAGWAAA
jgi:hypothetical protein